MLRMKAKQVDHGSREVAELISRMFESMHNAEGLGLAANQIGEALRVAIIDRRGTEDGTEDLVLINPEIMAAWGQQVREEGCLSLPEVWVKVKRAAHIRLKYQDQTGAERTLKASDLLASALQHEIDHLNGVLIVDRISGLQRRFLSGKLNKLKELSRGDATSQ